MMTDTAALVVFAIRSALRLGEQIRKSYIDATKRRDLVLPLPRFFAEIDSNDQAQWFNSDDGRPFQAKSSRLKEIVTKFATNQPLSNPEKVELKEFYTEFHTMFLAQNDLLPPADLDGAKHDLRNEEVVAWVTVRQWAKGTDPNPSTLKRMAGTFIDIGVDYFANMPGALQVNSGWGRALQGFLKGMDSFDFAEGQLADMPGRLLVATLETVAANSQFLVGDPKAQEVIAVTARSLSINVGERLAQIAAGDVKARDRVQDWAELTLRSVLSSAGRLVIAQPERFLGVSEEDRGTLITNVGNAVLGLVLDHPDQRLDAAFGREGLEKIVQAALATLGDHPEILISSKEEGLKVLLGETAKELSQFGDLLRPDLLPDLFRVVLEKTGENLDLLWPDLKKSPETNLLLTAMKATLAAVTEDVPGTRWKLHFTSQHLIQITDAVLADLVANPQWLCEAADAQSATLEATLRAVVKVLAQRGDERISPQTGIYVIEAVIRTVTLRLEFIQHLPGEDQPIIADALDTILGVVFAKSLNPNASWQLIRTDAIQGIIDVSFRLLSRTKLDAPVLAALKSSLKEEASALADGELFSLASYENRLDTALKGA